jgi:MYXO-CTERM domain-containing protein
MNQVSARSITPLRRMLAALLFIAGILGAPRMALAGGTLDQTSSFGSGSYSAQFNASAPGLIWQQQIKAGIAGPLLGIAIQLTGPTGGTLNLRIRRGAAPSAQPVLLQQLVTKTIDQTETILVDTTATLLSFAVGEIFVMEIEGTGTGLGINGSYIDPSVGPPLYPQPLFDGATPYVGWRFGFMTYAACSADAQCDDKNPCTTDTCTVATGTCVNANNTLSCSDGDSCTQNDVCSAGACVPGAPVTCAALDGCHAAGVCNPMTGVCSNPNKPDNSACSDANACTQTDTCQSGVCTGQSPVVCPAPDACHTAGSCDVKTGMCTNTAKADGTACNDSNACTTTDSCQAGVCTGQSPVVCAASDACHAVGLCDTMTGLCSNPAKEEGSACDDGTACTQGDTCVQGTCTSGPPVVCAAQDKCHEVGTCDTATGQCSNPLKEIDCSAKTVCEQNGVCDPSTGVCNNAAKPDGIPCGKGICIAGTCSDEAGNTTSSTGSGSTTTTGSTSTSTSTGVGGSGAGGSGAGGAGVGGASGGTGVGGSSATGISSPSATSTGNGAGNGDGTITPAGGCGCSTPGTEPVRAPWLLLGLLVPALRRRRRASRLAA